MNILRKVTWNSMWKNPTRTIVTILGVVLSAAMFMAVVTLGFSLRDYLLRGAVYENGDHSVCFHFATGEQAEALAEDERVSSVVTANIHGFFSLPYGEEGLAALDFFPLASVDDAFFDSQPVHLKQGRLPENSAELVVSEMVLSRLQGAGKQAVLGGTVTLDIFTDTSRGNSEGWVVYDYPQVESREDTLTYTIVGVMENLTGLVEPELGLPGVLTVRDGGEPLTLWHTLYAKTHKPSDAYAVAQEDHGLRRSVNNDVLLLLGATRYENWNTALLGICAVLIAIIMVGSVSLIYNAFSISVSERTREFGLLASVGATKKQLRQSVLAEGAFLCVIGIPLGLLCGWGGIAVTLGLMEEHIGNLFSFGGHVPLVAVVSLPSILCAGAISIFMVLLSANRPAMGATKITPMAAIRQAQDYVVTPRAVHVGPLTRRLFGVSGMMAKKYYSVSRKKYRSTVISLSISVILFLSASYFGSGLRETAESSAGVHNYDFVVTAWSETERETLQELSELEGIETVWLSDKADMTVVPMEQTEQEFADFQSNNNVHLSPIAGGNLLCDVRITYVEDEKLEAWLKAHGIDPAPYLDTRNPTALVQQLSTAVYTQTGETYTRRVITGYGVGASATELPLYTSDREWTNGLGDAVWEVLLTQDGVCYHAVPKEIYQERMNTDGTAARTFRDLTVGECYLMRLEDGQTRYYRYDPLTGQTGAEPVFSAATERTSVRLGKRVENMTLIDSVSDFYALQLVLPLSACPADIQELSLGIYAKGNAQAIRKFLEERDIAWEDYLGAEQEMRGTLLLIDVFSYGFIVLISLICVANVFNTISTNIALRRRDLGMLRSVGMKTRELYRMMHFECLIYGSRALLYGLPMGLLASFGIHQVFLWTFAYSFRLPWGTMLVAALCVFAVVFASMFYAVTKLRRDNPIEAIRSI